jgi:hypothetical protein
MAQARRGAVSRLQQAVAMYLVLASTHLIATEAADAFTVAVDNHDCERLPIMLCHSSPFSVRTLSSLPQHPSWPSFSHARCEHSAIRVSTPGGACVADQWCCCDPGGCAGAVLKHSAVVLAWRTLDCRAAPACKVEGFFGKPLPTVQAAIHGVWCDGTTGRVAVM